MMDEVEELAEGHVIVRGEDGQIVKSRLSSERASAMGKLAHLRPNARGVSDGRAREVAAAILAAMMPLADENANAARRVLIEESARLATETKGQGAISAIQSLAKQIGESFSALAAPLPGMKCRTCGNVAGQAVPSDIKISPAPFLVTMARRDEVTPPVPEKPTLEDVVYAARILTKAFNWQGKELST
jgi:hypothetical protein